MAVLTRYPGWHRVTPMTTTNPTPRHPDDVAADAARAARVRARFISNLLADGVALAEAKARADAAQAGVAAARAGLGLVETTWV